VARLIISQARSNPEVRYIHAYPTVSNAASNAIARKIGMENQGEFDNEVFAGVLRCNDWRIDLRKLDTCHKKRCDTQILIRLNKKALNTAIPHHRKEILSARCFVYQRISLNQEKIPSALER
jgi:hypothetical protein